MRFQALGVIALTASAGLCQTQPDTAAYSTFFHQVDQNHNWAARDAPPEVIQLAAGSMHRLVRTVPNAKEILGLSEDEMQFLVSVAHDCVIRIATMGSRSALIFDSRIEFIQTGDTKQSDKKLKALDARQDEILADCIRQLKEKLPEAAVSKIESYLNARPDQRVSLTPGFIDPADQKPKSGDGKK